MANRSATVGSPEQLKRAHVRKGREIPPEQRKQPGHQQHGPVTEHEPPTYEKPGTDNNSVTASQRAGRRKGKRS